MSIYTECKKKSLVRILKESLRKLLYGIEEAFVYVFRLEDIFANLFSILLLVFNRVFLKQFLAACCLLCYSYCMMMSARLLVTSVRVRVPSVVVWSSPPSLCRSRSQLAQCARGEREREREREKDEREREREKRNRE